MADANDLRSLLIEALQAATDEMRFDLNGNDLAFTANLIIDFMAAGGFIASRDLVRVDQRDEAWRPGLRLRSGSETMLSDEFARFEAEQPAAVKPLVAVGERIAEVMAEGDGHWTACTGCQESSEGCVSTTDYPYSAAFKCQPGGGCGECGGIGVIWTEARAYDGLVEFHQEYDSRVALERRVERKDIALRAARQIIANGIEFGFIRMPETLTDPAHAVLPTIDAALAI